jgi:hypothetical protein
MTTSALTHSPGLSGDWYAMYEERAAIMEFDGNLPRDQAEELAFAEVASMMWNHPNPGTGNP